MRLRLFLGDCVVRMATMPGASVGGIVCDPPYGLEFMGKEWDRLDWQAGGGFSKPGIGARQTSWPSFNAGTSNPTCHACGGRLRGARKCACSIPEWVIKGEVAGGSAREHGAAVVARQMRAQQVWHRAWLSEAYRVLVPGGVVKAFGGTRTFHRLTSAMEEAGFVDIRLEAWGHATGFPKSLDVGKAIDRQWGRLTSGRSNMDLKMELRSYFARSGLTLAQVNVACGFEASGYLRLSSTWASVLPSAEKWIVLREVLGAGGTLDGLFEKAQREVVGLSNGGLHRGSGATVSFNPGVRPHEVTIPATDEARLWEGWGTALKPAWEPVVVGRKPSPVVCSPGGLP